MKYWLKGYERANSNSNFNILGHGDVKLPTSEKQKSFHIQIIQTHIFVLT